MTASGGSAVGMIISAVAMAPIWKDWNVSDRLHDHEHDDDEAEQRSPSAEPSG
jgi:hypothetical protein